MVLTRPTQQWMPRALVLALLCASSMLEVSAPIAVQPAAVDDAFTPSARDHVRIILVGDTGLPGPELDTLRRTLMREPRDLVIGLGDLVYPKGPICSSGALNAEAHRIYDERLGAFYEPLETPVLLVIGNHEVANQPRDPAREACLLHYAARSPNLQMPGLNYHVDLGVALVSVVNTNHLTDDIAYDVQRAFKQHQGWTLLMGHHVLRTYHDKEREDTVRPWLRAHHLTPDLYAHGHAHLQQFGVYDNIPAIATGATAKLRRRPSCPPACGEGQRWGESFRGYAVVDITAERMVVTFKDMWGATRWQWERKADG